MCSVSFELLGCHVRAGTNGQACQHGLRTLSPSISVWWAPDRDRYEASLRRWWAPTVCGGNGSSPELATIEQLAVELQLSDPNPEGSCPIWQTHLFVPIHQLYQSMNAPVAVSTTSGSTSQRSFLTGVLTTAVWTRYKRSADKGRA